MSSESPERGVAVEEPICLYGFNQTHRFRKFEPPHLERELARQAEAKLYYAANDGGASGEPIAYSVSIQPCPDPEQQSQDRYVVESWDMPDGRWMFSGVFDGHAGTTVSEYAHKTLPSVIQKALNELLASTPNPDPSAISSLLSTCVTSLDDTIVRDLRLLFAPPETASKLNELTGTALLDFTSPDAYTADLERMKSMSVTEIKQLINDEDRGGKNAHIVERCKQGSTVLVTLIDPAKENVWVASLGDCVAVLGSVDDRVAFTILSEEHNGARKEEFEKMHAEHPGETTALFRKRVLGAIAVTRALGDMLFKIPVVYTKRVLMNSSSGFRTSVPVSETVQRVLTPPYLKGVPEVIHKRLVPLNSASNSALPARPTPESAIAALTPPASEPPTPTATAGLNRQTGMTDGAEVLDVSTEADVGIVVVTVEAGTPFEEDDDAEDYVEKGVASDTGAQRVEKIGAAEETPATGDSVSEVPQSQPLADESAVSTSQPNEKPKRFLILCSDGLVDLNPNEEEWVKAVQDSFSHVCEHPPGLPTPGAQTSAAVETDGCTSNSVTHPTKILSVPYSPSNPSDILSHPALNLLKFALGGEDAAQVSAMLSLEIMGRWMDDTTIVVLPI